MYALHNNWFARYYALLRLAGVLIGDPAHVAAAMQNCDDIRSFYAPCSRLAQESGDRRSVNMVAAGAVAAFSGIATPTALEEGMHAVVPAHRSDRLSANLAAVRAGYEWAEEQS